MGNVFPSQTQIDHPRKAVSLAGHANRSRQGGYVRAVFVKAMDAGDFVPRSQEMIIECGEYEWDGTKIVHVPSKSKGENNKTMLIER